MWAVIDIGSNTIRLVIYSWEDGRLNPMLNKKYPAGLAGYVDENNEISEEGVSLLIEILCDIEKILRYVRPEEVYPFGTAALRNSANCDKVLKAVKKECGFDIQILTGKEEAIFDYYGALEGGIGESGLLVDVGGGSTELAFFRRKEIIKATSIPLGSLNTYRKWVAGLLPGSEEAQCIKKEVKGYLSAIEVDREKVVAQPVYSVGGTARAALKLMREKYGDKELREFTLDQLREVLKYKDEDKKEILGSILKTSPDRVHTIIPGMLIFRTVAKFFGAESFVTVDYGVREGYLMNRLVRGGKIRERTI